VGCEVHTAKFYASVDGDVSAAFYLVGNDSVVSEEYGVTFLQIVDFGCLVGVDGICSKGEGAVLPVEIGGSEDGGDKTLKTPCLPLKGGLCR